MTGLGNEVVSMKADLSRPAHPSKTTGVQFINTFMCDALTSNGNAHPPPSGSVVTTHVITPVPAPTSIETVKKSIVLKATPVKCVVKLERLHPDDIAKYVDSAADVTQITESSLSTQVSQGSLDEQPHMTLHTRSTTSSKRPSRKASKSVTYVNMDTSSTESEKDQKRKPYKKKPRPALAPSRYWL